jgi:glycosyltransferase involved in cell wall biosynthesis
VRRSLDIDPQAPVAAIVAALRPEKNHEQFLRVAAEVRKRLPAARFLIVGDGPERPMLEQLAGELGLNDAVLFLGTRSDISDLLAACDVFVLTSRMEANPVSILEAMAAGKPVVAPCVGSIGESVIDRVTGYLTAPGDDAEVVDRVTELLADRPLAERLGATGREAVCARWSLEAMVTGYEDLLKSIYNQKCDRRRAIRPAATADTVRQRTR